MANILAQSFRFPTQKKMILHLLLCFLWIYTTIATQIEVNGISFYGMSTYSTDVEGYTGYMERDVYNADYVLFADGCALKSIDIKFKRVQLLAGNSRDCGYTEGISAAARFTTITGFEQLNHTHILIADISNHCIRLFDRLSSSTSTYAGTCTVNGTDNGRLLDAKLYYPDKFARKLNTNQVYFCEYYAIRLIDTAEEIITAFMDLIHTPASITFDQSQEYLYVSSYFRLAKINVKTHEFNVLSKSTSEGFQDGPLKTAMFEHVLDLRFLREDILLAFDTNNHRLRIIDLENSSVISICDGTDASADGDIISCQIRTPNTGVVLEDQSAVLVGSHKALRILRTSGLSRSNTSVALISTDKTEEETYPDWVIPVAVVSSVATIAVVIGIGMLIKRRPCQLHISCFRLLTGKGAKSLKENNRRSDCYCSREDPLYGPSVQEEQSDYGNTLDWKYDSVKKDSSAEEVPKVPNSRRPLLLKDTLEPNEMPSLRDRPPKTENEYSYAVSPCPSIHEASCSELDPGYIDVIEISDDAVDEEEPLTKPSCSDDAAVVADASLMMMDDDAGSVNLMDDSCSIINDNTPCVPYSV